MAAAQIHHVTQHRSLVQGVEARTINSERTFPRHFHDQLGIGVVLSGAHRSWSGIGHVEAQTGDAIMTNPGEMHDGMSGGWAPREWRMLYFEPAIVARVAKSEGLDDMEMVRPAVRDGVLATHFARLFRRITSEAPDLLGIEEGLVMLVMAALRRHGLRPPPARELSPPVKIALDRVSSDPASQISLTKLARLSGVSRFQLIRRFVREVGATPHAYALQRRVLLARRLLARGQSIVDAALNAGFTDQSHLTRAFVRQFGVTPGRYVAAIV